jgi:hypothetical protein
VKMAMNQLGLLFSFIRKDPTLSPFTVLGFDSCFALFSQLLYNQQILIPGRWLAGCSRLYVIFGETKNDDSVM